MDEVQYNVDGKQFMPGVIGMNNLGKTDWANCVIFMINSVKAIRKFYLLSDQF